MLENNFALAIDTSQALGYGIGMKRNSTNQTGETKMRTPKRQQAIDESYTAVTIAVNAIGDASGEAWSAHGDMIEFGHPLNHFERAIALLERAISELRKAADVAKEIEDEERYK